MFAKTLHASPLATLSAGAKTKKRIAVPADFEPSPVTHRFTIDGDAALEAHLAAVCARVREGVSRILGNGLAAILLGGGYGRGEGGVLRSSTGDKPYNDLEFAVFVRGGAWLAERRFRVALHQLAHALEPSAGVKLEFKMVHRAKLKRSPATTFFHDLYHGHLRVAGPTGFLKPCARLGDSAAIPLHEAARLLMNRCSGLLFAAERLQRAEFTAEDADFVARNIATAELALGDAVLVTERLYHHSARTRHARLVELAPAQRPYQYSAIVQLHRNGVGFELHPVQSRETREELQRHHALVSGLARDLFLNLESRRLGISFPTPEAYCADPAPKCPEAPAWRSTLANLRAFGLHAFVKRPRRLPRERLLRTLPLLLWEPAAQDDPRFSRSLAHNLLRPLPDFPAAVNAYHRIWQRCQ